MAGTLTGLAATVTRARRWTRWPEWMDSKLAWPGTACYYLALTNDWSFAHTVSVAARVFPFMICLAALGYAANDYWDRDGDVAAGKRAPDSAPGPAGQRWLVAGLLGATLVSAVPLVVGGSRRLAALVFLGLGLALAYSAPPLRLKTRGALGVLAAALVQWGTPPLPLLAGGAAPTPGFAILLVLGLSVGLRWMLLHQVQDAPHDARAGIWTFARAQGTARAMTILRGQVGLEAGLLVTWILVDGQVGPVLAAVSVVYLATYTLIAWRFGQAGRLSDLFGSYEGAPFRGLYLAWLPLGFLIALVRVDHGFAWLVPLELWWRRYQVAADLRLASRAAGLAAARSR
jgi:4-hydroxybenzoate polyprenyltransferase